jgi:DNA invertase Pin-like site-specific DNA recombinase
MAAVYGYARVSTSEQDLTVQRQALFAAGCSVIREEKRSATSRNGRTELQTLMQFLRKGDTLMVTRIDRLARLDEGPAGHPLRAQAEALKATEQPVDTYGGREGVS